MTAIKCRLAELLRRAANRLEPAPEPPPFQPMYWPTTPPMLTSTAGYACTMCGTFVPYGTPHMCNGFRITYNCSTAAV